ncbi:hypothetical protein [Microbispora sp. NPDC049125]|uniref:hypothetical protein n=1 Tax=Microbispora sp. NPDC049125 TaxID=3154929 RepID=UPI003464EA38
MPKDPDLYGRLPGGTARPAARLSHDSTRCPPQVGTLEMCAAMFAPAVPLFPLLWLGAIDGEALMMLAHVAMFPLMLAVMLRRRDEYAGCAG